MFALERHYCQFVQRVVLPTSDCWPHAAQIADAPPAAAVVACGAADSGSLQLLSADNATDHCWTQAFAASWMSPPSVDTGNAAALELQALLEQPLVGSQLTAYLQLPNQRLQCSPQGYIACNLFLVWP